MSATHAAVTAINCHVADVLFFGAASRDVRSGSAASVQPRAGKRINVASASEV